MLARSLVDKFNDGIMDRAVWSEAITGEATLEEIYGALKITLADSTGGTNYAGYASNDLYNLDDNSIFVFLRTAPNTATQAEAYLGLFYDDNNYIKISVSGGNIYAIKVVAGVQTNIANVALTNSRKWLRIREASGTIYFDYGASGDSWTNFASTTVAFAHTALGVVLQAGTYQSETSPGYAEFDNLNYYGNTLYWIGGVGNFEDGTQWSLTSGGAAANIVPSQFTDVVFDDNSFTANNQIVTVNYEIYCAEFLCINTNYTFMLDTTLNTKLPVATGDVFINDNFISNSGYTSIRINSASQSYIDITQTNDDTIIYMEGGNITLVNNLYCSELQIDKTFAYGSNNNIYTNVCYIWPSSATRPNFLDMASGSLYGDIYAYSGELYNFTSATLYAKYGDNENCIFSFEDSAPGYIKAVNVSENTDSSGLSNFIGPVYINDFYDSAADSIGYTYNFTVGDVFIKNMYLETQATTYMTDINNYYFYCDVNVENFYYRNNCIINIVEELNINKLVVDFEAGVGKSTDTGLWQSITSIGPNTKLHINEYEYKTSENNIYITGDDSDNRTVLDTGYKNIDFGDKIYFVNINAVNGTGIVRDEAQLDGTSGFYIGETAPDNNVKAFIAKNDLQKEIKIVDYVIEQSQNAASKAEITVGGGLDFIDNTNANIGDEILITKTNYGVLFRGRIINIIFDNNKLVKFICFGYGFEGQDLLYASYTSLIDSITPSTTSTNTIIAGETYGTAYDTGYFNPIQKIELEGSDINIAKFTLDIANRTSSGVRLELHLFDSYEEASKIDESNPLAIFTQTNSIKDFTITTPVYLVAGTYYLKMLVYDLQNESYTSEKARSTVVYAWASDDLINYKYIRSGANYTQDLTDGGFITYIYKSNIDADINYDDKSIDYIVKNIAQVGAEKIAGVNYNKLYINTLFGKYSYNFKSQSLFSAFDVCVRLAGGGIVWHYDNLGYFRFITNDRGNITHYLVKNIDVLEFSLEYGGSEIANSVYFTGGDTGGNNNLTLLKIYENSVNNYGLRPSLITDNRITSLTTANNYINSELNSKSEPTIKASIKAVFNNKSLGYKIGDIIALSGYDKSGVSEMGTLVLGQTYLGYKLSEISTMRFVIVGLRINNGFVEIEAGAFQDNLNFAIQSGFDTVRSLITKDNNTAL